MIQKIRKLCKQLQKFTFDEITSIAEINENKMRAILQDLEEENFIKKISNSQYAYIPVIEKDLPESQSIAEYKLDLLNAKAIGSLYKELNIKPFAKNTASSAAVELIDEKGDIVVAHYHGGPYFELDHTEETEILAHYNLTGFKPAVVLQHYRKGKVILSGDNLFNKASL